MTLPEHPCYYPHRSNTIPTTLRRNQKLGKPTWPARGLNALAHPNGPRAGPRLKQTTPSPLPRAPAIPSLTIRRWKTPWTVLKSLLTEQPVLRSGTGQPVAEARSALRPLPQIKLDCPPLPASGYRRRTGYPVLLRGELTLDFPLPAPASGGQRSQPSLEPMTDDGPVRPTILPGLGGGGDPSHAPGTPPCPHYLNVGSRIQQASFIVNPKPNRQNRNPTIEDGTSASGGLNKRLVRR